MRLCLAGTFPSEKIVRENRPEYVLESFFYIKPWQVEEMPKWKMFLLLPEHPGQWVSDPVSRTCL